ncbi:hypothetical protein [Actinokineospora diospyrosa]|uniref:DUF3040 family protein n=1 Tax=Actinokineospora diospyrosa TaxID=103728 RepID=A0ABT1ILM5_9PSEU|nr:hypothetical protein [Actinokineospora diospyrosa]MCP2273454.1 hypothetical protein [Actinokineospora diospyrosa]
MRIRTDDEVYRVDAVWLGPPKATFPFRARYVAWGVGTVVFLLALTVLRNLGVGLFWSFAWGLVATIALTMLICSRISHERPLAAVLTMWVRELNSPRETTTGTGGAVSAGGVKVRAELPRRRQRGSDKQRAKTARRAEEARRRARAARSANPQAPRTSGYARSTRNREASGVRTP